MHKHEANKQYNKYLGRCIITQVLCGIIINI